MGAGQPLAPSMKPAGFEEDRMNQAVKDALADAETLWQNAQHGPDAVNRCWLLLHAREAGDRASLEAQWSEDAYAAADAASAAHAAFCAVPGLR